MSLESTLDLCRKICVLPALSVFSTGPSSQVRETFAPFARVHCFLLCAAYRGNGCNRVVHHGLMEGFGCQLQ